MVEIKIKKLREDAILPSYAHSGDAGMDFYSVGDFVLEQGQRMAIPTGISMELPEGYVALVWGKSGLAVKNGVAILGGVIEHTYRGEYKILVLNTGYDDLIIKKGQKIAQVLIQPIVSAEIKEVEELSETVRGENGFGSSGL